MLSDNETKIGYVYAIFIIIMLALVVGFLLCDFQVIGQDTCSQMNGWVTDLSRKMNSFFGTTTR